MLDIMADNANEIDYKIDGFVEEILEVDDWLYTFFIFCDNHLDNMEKFYKKITYKAQYGNIRAIIILYYLAYYDYYHIEYADLINFILKLSYDNLTTICDKIFEINASGYSNGRNSYNDFKKFVTTLLTKLIKAEDEIVKLKEDNCKLMDQIKYMLGGDGYRDAKHEFDSIAKQN